MATKVGEGYIEVEPRFNRNNLQKIMAQAGRDSSTAFTKGFTRQLNDNDTWERWNANRLRNFQRTSIAIKRDHDNLNRALSSAMRTGTSTMAGDAAKRIKTLETALVKSERVMKTHSARAGKDNGNIFFRHLLAAGQGVLSLMPARLEQVFTKTGAVAGTAFVGAFSYALLVGLPALGAMVSGLLFAGIGFSAAIAAAFVGAAQDGGVKRSMKNLKSTLSDIFVDNKGAQGIGKIFSEQIDKFTAALRKLGPAFAGILNAGARFLVPITDSFIGVLNILVPAFDKILNNPAMMLFIKGFGVGLQIISQAFAGGLLKFMQDPKAVKGAQEGLHSFFLVLASAIRGVLNFMEILSRMWEMMNNPKNGMGGKSPLENLRQGIGVGVKGIEIGFKAIIIAAQATWAFLQRLWRTDEIQAIWRVIKDIVVQGAQLVMAWVTRLASFWSQVWARTGKVILANLVLVWRDILRIIQGALQIIKGVIEFFLGLFTLRWGLVWRGIKDVFGGIWKIIVNTLKGALTLLWTDIHLVLAIIQTAWKSVWSHVFSWWKSVTTSAWNWMFAKLEAFAKFWASIWKGVGMIFTGIWKGVVDTLRTGLNWVIGIINAGIRLINAVLSTLRIPWKIPLITPIGASAGAPPTVAGIRGTVISKQRSGGQQRFATGGRIEGPGGMTSDRIPILASNDEYIIRGAAARKLGYDKLDHMNRTGSMPGFADGGRVSPALSGLLEEHRNHVHVAMQQGINYIIALANKSGIPHNVTSTFRAGSTSNGHADYHSMGKAVDFGGFNQDAFASYWFGQPGLLELIHRSNARDYYYHNGVTSGGAAGGGALGAFGRFLGRGWNWTLAHTLKPVMNKAVNLIPHGGNFVEQFGHGVMKNFTDSLLNKLKIDFQSASAATPGGTFSGSASQWKSTVMQALQMENEPMTWVNPLLTLIQRESGGNPHAINLNDINAQRGDPSKGLMQVIGATFNRYKYPGHDDIYDPLSNILAGIAYIKARYGSVFNVQQAVGATPRGYDAGGYLPPGLSTVYNGTSRPEPVLTGSQWNAVGKGGDTHVTVLIDGVAVAHRAVVEENNAGIVRALKSNG